MSGKAKRTPEVNFCACVGSDNPDQHAWAPLTKGYVTLVSPDDSDLLAYHCWLATGYRKRFYAGRIGPRPDRKSIRLHREVTGAVGKADVDHVNGDSLDNRRHNLRPATRSQNVANGRRRSDNKAGLKGVSFHKDAGRYRATCRGRHVGYYDCPVEAGRAYDAKAREVYGEFALTNFSEAAE